MYAKSILLIEDDIDDQKLFKEALCKVFNISVLSIASNGKEALDILNNAVLHKGDKPFCYGLLGSAILILYGVVATLQTANFARVYATYGGFFIVMSLLWHTNSTITLLISMI
jgi:CheY-like chemotaxis protein